MTCRSISNHTAILICTHDGAADLWKPLYQTYRKYWPDCPFNIYLGTNHIDPNLDLFTALTIGDEKSWSDNILKCLGKIKEENVLLIFDDVFLYKTIDSELINKHANTTYENSWNYLRLSPLPLFDEEITDGIGKIYKNRIYRTSTAWAIFKKEVLVDLLEPTESAWDFEIIGSERSNKYSDFYAVNSIILPYLNGMVKGKWVRKVFKYLKNEGFSVTDRTIKQMGVFQNMFLEFKKLRTWLFLMLIPKSVQLKIRKYFHK